MKKILAFFSTVICLFLVSQVHSNQPDGQYYFYPEQAPCARPCVGRCEDPCVRPVAHSAQDGRFYIGGMGGANWVDVNHPQVGLGMKRGYIGAGSLGYKFNNGCRVEAEVAYRTNHFKHVNSYEDDLYQKNKVNGKASTWSYMANFLYDFDHLSDYCPDVVPYVGVGIGYKQTTVHVKDSIENDYIGGINQTKKGHAKVTSEGIAGQVITGVSYRLTPKTSLGVEYRYFAGAEHVKDHSVGVAIRQSF